MIVSQNFDRVTLTNTPLGCCILLRICLSTAKFKGFKMLVHNFSLDYNEDRFIENLQFRFQTMGNAVYKIVFECSKQASEQNRFFLGTRRKKYI